MMILRIELEHTDWQTAMVLINAGGMLANMAPVLLGKITEQLQAQQVPQQVPRGNGDSKPVEAK
jgi:hypothetical protein